MTRYRIPVRVVKPLVEPRRRENGPVPGSPGAINGELPPTMRPEPESQQIEEAALDAASLSDVSAASGSDSAEPTGTKERARTYRSSEDVDWRELALRLQADMENYRRRQQQMAEMTARGEQVELLQDILGIADNLERALEATQGQMGEQGGQGFAQEVYQGVDLTRIALQRVLSKHGLERIDAAGAPFDPAWHQALHVLPASALGVQPGTVVEVLGAGYRRHGKLFRPAKVVVAQ
jgi:molecular chaperone GrpE